jgi:transposase
MAMTNGAKYRDAEWLREHYIGQGMRAVDVAEKCNCSGSTVRRWLKKHGIKVRKRGGSDQQRRERDVPDRRLLDVEWLREQYIKQKQDAAEIAEKCGCAGSTVRSYLHRHNIQTRAPNAPEYRLPDTRVADAEWLREQYVEQERSGHEIAGECDCSWTVVYTWLNKHGIEVRKRGNGSRSGAEHPKWEGGPAPYGAGWNETKRQAVRERDGYACQDPRCSVTQAEHREAHGEKLHVHHLQKARHIEDAAARNAKENLIALCRDCHRRWEKMADAGIVPEFVDKAAEQDGETA